MSIKNELDPRVKRTRLLLQEALLSLMSDKEFDAITVQDITKQAGVNRATFYAHYEDKYHMIRQICRDMLQQLVQATKFLEPSNNVPPEEMAYQSFLHLFEHIEENNYFYKVLLSRKGSTIFINRMYTLLQESYEKAIHYLQPNHLNIKVANDLLTSYITGATMSTIKNWLEKDMPYTPRYIAEQLLYLAKNGIFVAAGIGSK
ncbi:TetR/AcrR family transcriptional regulator [Bacillus sp. RG28]|uniref:TetR/AcrR family transcriptional regulator n=1 Tax=Gottfriedia endophytica TaxID=2820819 RepID=A0A940SJ37_9BACI|nr:TetR/AcrR family transcriptional regulator [Gottfriedia endophytica]MBP0725071.1 TetR/AcrR family transcriptional regulator [Gottfriedia endophytica]